MSKTFKTLLELGQTAETEAIKRIELLNKTRSVKRQDETNYKIMHH